MNTCTLEPYLFFNGNCEEALEFYQKAIDAKLEALMRYGEAPEGPPEDQQPPNWSNKILHASIKIGESVLMASDGCGETHQPGGFGLSLNVKHIEIANRYFQALSEKGKIICPLGPTFFAPYFGMVQDQYGILWMIGVHQPPQP